MDSQNTTDEIVFTLRVPLALNEKLVADAKAENRSRQSHIVFLLNRYFGETKNGKEKKK